MRRRLTVLGIGILCLVVAVMTVWGTLFLWFSNIESEIVRGAMAGAFAIGTILLFARVKLRRRALLAFAAVFAVLATSYFSIPPSHDRDWAPEFAVLPEATVNGNLVEIRNIRNFEYRTETDFTPRYYDKTFDLDQLQGVDLVTVTWGSPAIAHIMTSFEFADGQHLACSIEMRKERNEAGSMLSSMFRKFELIYIMADERDVIRLRTHYREPREKVRIYRTRIPVVDQRKLFLSYIDKVNELARTPEWYNAIEDNCTTGVLERTHAYHGRGHYNWKVLFSGYVDEYAYELGVIDTGKPFAELRELSLVNPRAERADNANDFSVRIRKGLPRPAPFTLEEFEAPR